MTTAKNRLLTKSRFKMGCECPTKLYYNDRPSEFANAKVGDTFLEALARGGFQVGALAQIQYPEGIEVKEKDYATSVVVTNRLLSAPKATIFEAAVRSEELFVRVDILKKISPTLLEINEVKAKSIDPSETSSFFNKKSRKLSAKWQPYLLDLAFQTYVVRCAFPEAKTTSYLMLIDKTKVATVDGLNQRFMIEKTPDGRSQVVVIKPGTTAETCGESVLVRVNVDEAVEYILNEMFESHDGWKTHVAGLAKTVTSGVRAIPTLSKECKDCEFRVATKELLEGQKSGFLSCWQEVAGMSQQDYDARLLAFDIGGFQAAKTMPSKRYFADQLVDTDFSGNEASKSGLSTSERQLLQVAYAKSQKHQVYLDQSGLAGEMSRWKFPLHFIDFETTTMALPFNKDRRPYETIAFQFSHHVVEADGSIEHRSEYIHRKRGEFPNFDFVRALKKSLEENGTIFRYAPHENTVLCHIHTQLENSKEPDAAELMTWIESITTKKGDKETPGWSGERTMVDLFEIVKRFYWSPYMKGSNSIKKVLPAVLKESAFLRGKYSEAIYGTKIKSHNFKNHAWLKIDPATDEIQDPYKFLPPVFGEDEALAIEAMFEDDEINDGGTAMMAYAKTQFTEMSDAEAQMIYDALLRYCELDTMAMVMIYEYWVEEVRSSKNRVDTKRS